MTDPESFGQWLRKRRRSIDLTQEALADLISCSPETIRKIEAGRRTPSRQLVEVLGKHLGVSADDVPDLITFARIGPEVDLSGTESRTQDQQPPQPTSPPSRSSLPAWPTTFVGRTHERQEVRDMLVREDVRLLTLIGPPGIGKTRLSTQVAVDLADHFRDGVCFVRLSPVTDPAQVAPAIAQALGVKDAPNRPIVDILCDYLRDKEMLLVLDNFEQIIPAGQLVGELLSASRGLTVMVSSRTALRVYGEHEFPVPPMSLPEPAPEQDGEADLEKLSGYESVQLFIERARAVKYTFELTSSNAPIVAEICRRLDGLPLAIELAAALSKLFSPEALLRRMNKMLDLLSGPGMQDLPPRQQTLRGAIAWSYDLLSEAERKLYRRMAVFVGGATLDGIESICLDDGDFDTDVLGLAASLMEKSLLRQTEESGEPLFGMLWTIREYGLERLAENGEASATKSKHALYYMQVAEEAEPYLTSGARTPWLELLDRDSGNLRAALEWCRTDEGDHEVGLRIAGALHWYWYFRGHLTEGRDQLEKALAVAGPLRRTAAGARALDAAGKLALLQDDYELMISRLEESVAVWREIGDKRGLAYALANLGLAKVYKDRDASSGGVRFLEESVSLFREIGDKWGLAYALDVTADATNLLSDSEQQIDLYGHESLALFRELGDQWGIASELTTLGHAALRHGDFEKARVMLEEALPVHKITGDRWVTGHVIRSLGDIAWHEGDFARAKTLYAESLRLFREVGDRLRTSFSLRNLGRVAQSTGDLEEARTLCIHSLTIAHDLGSVQNIALCLAALAGVSGAQGQPVRAARLFGAADALREASHGLMPSTELLEHDRSLADIRADLGEEAFAAAWEQGRALTLKQAVTYAYGNGPEPGEEWA